MDLASYLQTRLLTTHVCTACMERLCSIKPRHLIMTITTITASAIPNANHRVATFLEFLETWKCQGISQRSGNFAKIREKAQVREESEKGQGICVDRKFYSDTWRLHGHVLRTSYNLPVLYVYFNAPFCTSDVQCFELTLVSC